MYPLRCLLKVACSLFIIYHIISRHAVFNYIHTSLGSFSRTIWTGPIRHRVTLKGSFDIFLRRVKVLYARRCLGHPKPFKIFAFLLHTTEIVLLLCEILCGAQVNRGYCLPHTNLIADNVYRFLRPTEYIVLLGYSFT